MNEERVFIEEKVNVAIRGYYVRCPQLKQAIERIEGLKDEYGNPHRVVGIVYDGENSIELLLDPTIGDDEE